MACTGRAEVQRRNNDAVRQTPGPSGVNVLFEIDETGHERKPFHRFYNSGLPVLTVRPLASARAARGRVQCPQVLPGC